MLRIEEGKGGGKGGRERIHHDDSHNVMKKAKVCFIPLFIIILEKEEEEKVVVLQTAFIGVSLLHSPFPLPFQSHKKVSYVFLLQQISCLKNEILSCTLTTGTLRVTHSSKILTF